MNDPDWTKYRDPDKMEKMRAGLAEARRMDALRTKWYPRFDLFYNFVYKPIKYLVIIWLVWSVWQYLDGTK